MLLAGLGTRSVFTASTVDQMPKHVSSGLLYGDANAIPVPDLDHTDHLLLIGANPLESNGSLCTAPDFPGKLRALKARGGTLVVIDPRRTRTARLADRHIAVRPGTDALLLAAMAQVLYSEGLVEPTPHVQGVEELADALREFTPEAVAPACDVDSRPHPHPRPRTRRRPHRRRIRPHRQLHRPARHPGQLARRRPEHPHRQPRPAGRRALPAGRHRQDPAPGRTRPRLRPRALALPGVRHPEAKGELPLSALAEEIDTATEEGEPVRAIVAVAANPVLSAPDGDRLDKALDSLDFMVSVDPYLNETSRHAHVVLPPPPPSRSPHHDFAFNTLAVRNQVRYTRPAIPLEPGRMAETEILARLILAVTGMHGADPAAVDQMVIDQTLGKAVKEPHSPVHGRDPRELADGLHGDTGPERRLDMMLRLGPYGDGFGVRPDGLTLEKLLAHPHGIDLGPLRSRLPQPLKTRSGRVELLPGPIAADLPRLRAALAERPEGLVLVGRRHLRSNNSWMHNVPALTGGSNRCTLHIHPEDAERLGVMDGAPVRVKGAGGEVTAPAEVTDAVRRGVVSLPHGWGHDRPGTRLSHASTDPGVNVNQLLDGRLLDPLSGNAVLNGVPVECAPAAEKLMPLT